jgi:nitroreductase
LQAEILSELANRKSPLLFSDQNIELKQLHALVEAARWAPSCSNNQSWSFIFVNKLASTRVALEDSLTRGNAWAKRAPYLVVVAADPLQDCRDNDLPYYAYDAGLSVMCLVIEAEHLGLKVHQMAGWDEERAKQALGVPSNFRLIVVFALGYEADPKNLWSMLDERTRNKLTRPRVRKSVNENFFSERYGKTMNGPGTN